MANLRRYRVGRSFACDCDYDCIFECEFSMFERIVDGSINQITAEVVHLDAGCLLPLAVPYSYLRYPSDHYAGGATARVRGFSPLFFLPSLLNVWWRSRSKIEWECDNGGQLWQPSVTAGYQTNTGFPTAFCASGFSSLNTAFIFSLLIDIGCQLYMYFLTWRFMKRIEHYADMKGPFAGGYYAWWWTDLMIILTKFTRWRVYFLTHFLLFLRQFMWQIKVRYFLTKTHVNRMALI